MIAAISIIFSTHFYFMIFKEGVDSEYIKIKSNQYNILNGTTLEIDATLDKNSNIWKDVHLQNFYVMAPFSHPLIYFTPIIKNRYKDNQLGLNYHSTSGTILFSFHEDSKILFKTEMDKNKLFSIPLIRSVIFTKSSEEIFKDLFSKELFFGENKPSEFTFDLAKKILKTDWKKLVYNLFLFKLRQNYFAFNGIEKISWVENKKFGIISFSADKSGETEEHYFFLNNGVIYIIKTLHKNWNGQSIKMRENFIQRISFQETNRDAPISIYGEYRLLGFNQQIGLNGMIYLFSAWSHHQDNKKFYKEMVQRMERGKDNNEQLRKLYSFALEKYGQTFSRKEEINAQDSQKIRLENKVLEERERLDKEKAREIKDHHELEEMDFESSDEKMEYFLNEALKKEN